MTMRKIVVGLTVAGLLALAPVASGHPSENRNLTSTFGGPHCHINLMSENFAFPSHNAHVQTGLSGGVFTATTCPE
jgi:hypothetical protein